MIDWTVVGGVGIPVALGIFFLVRMENRVCQLEVARLDDQRWRSQVSLSLTSIARDLNQLIGAQGRTK